MLSNSLTTVAMRMARAVHEVHAEAVRNGQAPDVIKGRDDMDVVTWLAAERLHENPNQIGGFDRE